MLQNLWGRMVSCGRVVLGLVGICMLVGRPSATRPEVANLPHKECGITHSGVGPMTGLALPANSADFSETAFSSTSNPADTS
jgi:hypothetical protein